MAVWKCTTCGSIKEGRCKPRKCAQCGNSKFEKVVTQTRKPKK